MCVIGRQVHISYRLVLFLNHIARIKKEEGFLTVVLEGSSVPLPFWTIFTPNVYLICGCLL